MAGRGLFALAAPSPDIEEDEGLDEFEDDLAAGDDLALGDSELEAGPFEAYAETVLDANAPMPERIDALRQCMLTLLEERDRG